MNVEDANKYKIICHSLYTDEDRIVSAFAIVFQRVTELLTQQEIEKNGDENYERNIL